MDFSFEQMKSHRVDLGSYEPEPKPLHIQANVVLIDYSSNGQWSNAYQFLHDRSYNDSELMAIEENIHAFPEDAFIMIGEVDNLNKQSKTVLLRDGSVIFYKHLISISRRGNRFLGSSTKSQEFHAALQSLIYALRFSKKISPKTLLALLAVKTTENQLKFQAKEEPLLPLAVPLLVKDASPYLPATPFGKRLYELQI